MSLTIGQGVKHANAKGVDLKKDKPAGSQRAIRKKCNAIVAASKPDIQHRYWCIILTEISTMLHSKISSLFVKTVWKKCLGVIYRGAWEILHQMYNLLIQMIQGAVVI
jgi:hypothetical protein